MIIPRYCDSLVFFSQNCKLKPSEQNLPRKHHTQHRQSPFKTHKHQWTVLFIRSIILCGLQTKFSDLKG